MRDFETGGRVHSDPWQLAPYTDRTSVESPFDPVRGVSLELFTEIAHQLASRSDPAARGIDLAAEYGIRASDWVLACRTWNRRVSNNQDVADRLYALGRPGVHDIAS